MCRRAIKHQHNNNNILWPLSKVTHVSLISTSFALKPLDWLKSIFMLSLHDWLTDRDFKVVGNSLHETRGLRFIENRWGHMTKMATISIYSKNLEKSLSLELNSQWSWILVCSIWYSSTAKFLQMMTQGWPLTFLHKCQLWFFMHFYGRMLKWWITQKKKKLLTFMT